MDEQKPDGNEAADLDIFDVAYNTDPGPVWRDLRERCPFARTEKRGGFWLTTTYDDVQSLVRKVPELSNRQVSVVEMPEDRDLLGDFNTDQFPPITKDPPENIPLRRALLPFFTPKAVEVYRPFTQALCNDLIDKFIAKGACDAAVDYAQQITPRVIGHMLGIGTDRADDFVQWVRGFIEYGFNDQELRAESHRQLVDYFTEQLARRRAEPGDDFISQLLEKEIEGEPLTDKVIVKMCVLTLAAGIDTTWSSIGSSLLHFASHDADRRRLAGEPALFPTAIEEMLRLHAPVSVGRIAMEDVAHNDATIKRGERLILNFPAANRDPAVFDRPDEAVLDRAKNRHVAFGIGVHRCAGSNLARMEMDVALRTWFARIPEFTISDPDGVTWAAGQVRGARNVPVQF